MHKTRGNGQLLPLEGRMTKEKLMKREVKIQARRELARELIALQAQLHAKVMSILGRKFFGRFKWLLFGK